MLNFIAAFGGESAPSRLRDRVANERMSLFQQILARIMARGRRETAMVNDVLRAARRKPATLPAVAFYFSRYEQFRCVLDGAGNVPVAPAAETSMLLSASEVHG